MPRKELKLWFAPAVYSRRLMRRLILLGGGVIVLHTLVTILEEALFARPTFRAQAGSTFMTLTFYTMAAVVYAPRGSGSAKPRISRRVGYMIAASSTLYVTTTTLSKTALAYIDLPMQSILKSAKLLPVMLGSIVILGQGFSLREWAAATMLVSGIATFSASGQQLPGAQTLRGGMCVMVALACDAALGNYQKKVLQQGVTVQMLMLYQSLAGMAYMAVATVASGTLGSGCRLLVSGDPVALMLLGWAAALTAGTALILRLVDEFSAVTAITVTTLRKAGTLFASFVLFPKPLGIGHPIGAALVLGSAFVKAGVKCRCSRSSRRGGGQQEAASSAEERGELLAREAGQGGNTLSRGGSC
jgi:drug/metabolite transporter (DMT)-like permease